MTNPSSEPTPARSHRRSLARRVLLAFLALLTSLVGLVVVLVTWTVPYLAERGDLNDLVASAIRAGLHPDLDVTMDFIETDPLTRLAVTSIKGVRTRGSRERFSFQCDRVTLLYNPVDLWRGRIEELTLVRPRLFVDLDRDVADLFEQVMPQGDGAAPRVPVPAQGDSSYRLGHLGIRDGTMRLRYAGREFQVDGLELEVFGLGGADLVAFDLRAILLGAALEARGRLVPSRGGVLRFRDTRVHLDGVDVAPLLDLLPGIDATGAGRLTLRGSVAGAWPDRVDVRLEAELEGVAIAAAPDSDVAAADDSRESAGARHWVDAGALTLGVDATVMGELEAVDWRLTLGASGRLHAGASDAEQRLELALAGRFESAGSGVLRLEESSLVTVDGVGVVRPRGSVLSALDAPRLELDVDVELPDLAALSSHALLAELRPITGELSGELLLRTRLRGPLAEPTLEAIFEASGVAASRLPGVTVEVAGEIASATRLLADTGPILEGVGVRCTGIGLEAVADALGVGGEGGAVEGAAALTIRVPRVEGWRAPQRVDASIDVRELVVSRQGVLETEPIALDLDLALVPRQESGGLSAGIEAQGTLSAKVAGLAVGPWYVDLEGETTTATVEVDVQHAPGDGTTVALTLRGAPSMTGPLEVAARAAWPAAAADMAESPPRLDIDLVATEVPCERVFRVFVVAPLAPSHGALENASLSGRARLRVSAHDVLSNLAVSGRVTLEPSRLVLPAPGLEVEGLRVDLPFELGVDASANRAPLLADRRGSIALASLTAGEFGSGPLALALELEDDVYRLRGEPLRIEALGGSVRVPGLEIRPLDSDAHIVAKVDIAGLDLAQAARLGGLDGVEGRVDGSLDEVRLAGDDIVARGEVVVAAFGGELRLRDLAVHEWSAPWATFSLGSGTIRELDLLRLGETFQFGIISGVLQGEIRDLVFVPGELSRFDVELETVRRPGVSQYISTAALRSLLEVVSGPLSAAEGLLFAKFRYEGFGFTASLRNNAFRLRGNYEIDGVEHLMYSRWWQLPRIRIVNTRPGKRYDWRAIHENIEALYKRR